MFVLESVFNIDVDNIMVKQFIIQYANIKNNLLCTIMHFGRSIKL